MASLGIRKRIGSGGSKADDQNCIVSRAISGYYYPNIVATGKRVAGNTAFVAKKLLKSTGKAAWITVTTFLIIGLPLLIVTERESQLNAIELEQQILLGIPPPSPR